MTLSTWFDSGARMYDVLVIGAGHAGVEAATGAARCGARTGLLTFSACDRGAMSCNPAIGGLGKGHIVREIDAFDGLMARCADRAAIHYRMLNGSKGAAVRGPRVQADRRRYAAAVSAMIDATRGLDVVEAEVVSLHLDRGRLGGVELADGSLVPARTVVIATGTFLGATIFRGEERHAGGRNAAPAASAFAVQLRDLDLPMGRLKTGTPPRLDGRSIDWAGLEEQQSDRGEWTMSAMTDRRCLPPVACAITRTNAVTHGIIRGALDRSPLYSGAIHALGPRYCPSIEDKIDRFGDRDGHQIFLEPEGLDDPIVYPNGLSTSLPAEVQQAMIASIPGLERAIITAPGYAVEYDHIDPRALDARLALRALPGVFCAGQINGTTGYEEAAGQGLLAGINAAATALDRAPTILDRASSYIGVMIDDLVLHGVTEPYRMLTARAEYRLALRADNAQTRLGEIARAVGCVSRERAARQRAREAARLEVEAALQHPVTAVSIADRGGPAITSPTHASGGEWLRHPGVRIDHLLDDRFAWPEDVLNEASEDARYRPYLDRQAEEIARLRREEGRPLPSDLDYRAIAGLSREMVDRLEAARPESLGGAARIRGITPAAVAAVHLHLHRSAA